MQVTYGRQVSPTTTIGNDKVSFTVTSDPYIVLDKVDGLEVDYKQVGSVKIGDQWFSRVNNPKEQDFYESHLKMGPVQRLP